MGMTGATGSKGIYVFRQNSATQRLDHLHTAEAINPSFLALDNQQRWLFAVNEVRDFDGALSGAVTSFAIDRVTGELRFISRVASGGGNPCHLSVSPSDNYLFVANHEAGNIAVLPIDGTGRLSSPIDVKWDEPVDERPPHAHFVVPDSAGNFILSSDTGTDRVVVYRFKDDEGRLRPNDPPWGETHRGGSPRHLAFSTDGRYVFANGEADMSLSLFRYDSDVGRLHHLQHTSTVDRRSAVTSQSTAQLQVHPNGRFLYVSNRGDDDIAVFWFDNCAETVKRVANESTLGKTPRNFSIDPTGRALYVANQNSDRVECFRINQDSGLLTHAGTAAYVPAPTCILFT